jgi:hypothetical protein
VQHDDYEVERDILSVARTVLDCSCGEKLILLGREEDWYSEGRTTFECHQCEGVISLANLGDLLDEGQGPIFTDDSESGGIDEEGMSIKDLVRSLRIADR